jgi:hypothetical protein
MLSEGQIPLHILVILEDGIVIFLHTIQQWFPAFYVCGNKAANGM